MCLFVKDVKEIGERGDMRDKMESVYVGSEGRSEAEPSSRSLARTAQSPGRRSGAEGTARMGPAGVSNATTTARGVTDGKLKEAEKRTWFSKSLSSGSSFH